MVGKHKHVLSHSGFTHLCTLSINTSDKDETYTPSIKTSDKDETYTLSINTSDP